MSLHINKMYSTIIYLYFIIGLALCDTSLRNNITDHLDIKKYTLTYDVDLNKDTFVGTVDIEFTPKKNNKVGKTLILDNDGLTINDATFTSGGIQQIVPVQIGKDKTITVELEKPLLSQVSYTLSFYFSGKLTNNDGFGLYNAYGKKYISTNFYPFNAAKAFPCFNDPLLKSIFSLTIVISGDANAVPISNMPYVHKSVGTSRFQFKDTPKITLYNLFFTIGHYELMNNIYVPQKLMNFNNEFIQILNNEEFKKLLNISNLPSVKIISVPGLLESTITGYDLIAIRQENLFVDLEKITTEQRKETLLDMFGGAFKVFYGNSLIPRNWSDVWLIESIPIYLKYNGLSKIEGWSNYIGYELQRNVLGLNAQHNSRPIVDRSMKTQEDVLNLLSSPSMLKGAGILSMLESVLSKEILTDVIIQFYDEALGNLDGIISTEDFLIFLNNNQDVKTKLHDSINVKEIMNSWLYQPGYPYVQTQRAGNAILINQKEFLSGPLQEEPKLWKFPVFYSDEMNPDFDNDKNYFWLLANENRTVSLNFTVPMNNWFIINVNGAVPYRVNYENHDWLLFTYALMDSMNTFPANTRAQLINDAFAMLFVGKAKFSYIFSFLTVLNSEESLNPWLNAVQGFDYLGNLLHDTDLKNDYDSYINTMLGPIYLKLGIDNPNKNIEDGILRQKIVSTMCKYQNEQCLKQTATDYKKMMDPNSGYSPNNDIRPVIICNGIKNLNKQSDWEQIYQLIFNDNLIYMGKDLRRAYYEALACPLGEENNVVINKYLDTIFVDKQYITKEDVPIAFKAIYSNPEHKFDALVYLLKNEPFLRKDITMGEKISLLRSLTPYLSTQNEMDFLNQYLTVTSPPKQLKDAVLLTRQYLTITQNFIKNHYNEIKLALKTVEPPTTVTVPPTHSTSSGTSEHTTNEPSDRTTNSTGSDATTTPTTPHGNTTVSTTTKPNSSSIVSMFNLFTLMLIFFGLRCIT